jgi:alpha-N-arabinofuranosidase
LALIPKPEWPGSCNYGVSFEARFVPEPGSAVVPLGLSVGDARGWPATRSALGISGIGQEWKPFQATYRGIPDTKALALQARLEFGSAKISGQFEVRGLKIEAFSAPTFPTYALLTGCATLSDDGKTLHLIVFNKTLGQDIPATLRVANFHAASARVSEVNGASLAAVAVTETVHDAPLDLSGTDPVHVFPAHSMTAIDFVAQPHSQKP